MRNIRLVIEYDGTNFVGWQMQRNGRTVQEEIAKVLEQVLQEPIVLTGSGRTDSGVHARGQIANFKTHTSLGTGAIFSSLNGLLPEDIYVHSVSDVPEDFSARYSAKERMYRYFIATLPTSIGRYYQWFVKYDLNLAAMNEAAGCILGEHDFTSFSKYDREVRHYHCKILASAWTEGRGQFVYEIRANRFMHGMVRGLVGTMVDVGRGFTSVTEFKNILAACDRRRAGMAAPPQGLFLEEVVY